MSHWETIQDRSSHISPVKLQIQRDYSSERVEDMFKTICKNQPITNEIKDKKKSSIKQKYMILIGIVLVTIMGFIFQDNLVSKYNAAINYQHILDNTALKFSHFRDATAINYKHIKDTTTINYNHIKDTTAINYKNIKDTTTKIYNQIADVVILNYRQLKDIIKSIYIEFNRELENYIQSGKTKNPDQIVSSVGSIKRTEKAKRILKEVNAKNSRKLEKIRIEIGEL